MAKSEMTSIKSVGDTILVVQRSEGSGTHLAAHAREAGMSPITLLPGKHRSPLGGEIIVTPGNIGLVFTSKREIALFPQVLTAYRMKNEGYRLIEEAETLRREGRARVIEGRGMQLAIADELAATSE